MARVSAEDCIKKIPNAFALCVVAAIRARQLAKGQPPLVQCDNREAVTSLREIAAGKVTLHETVEHVLRLHVAEVKTIERDRSTRLGGNGARRGAK